MYAKGQHETKKPRDDTTPAKLKASTEPVGASEVAAVAQRRCAVANRKLKLLRALLRQVLELMGTSYIRMILESRIACPACHDTIVPPPPLLGTFPLPESVPFVPLEPSTSILFGTWMTMRGLNGAYLTCDARAGDALRMDTYAAETDPERIKVSGPQSQRQQWFIALVDSRPCWHLRCRFFGDTRAVRAISGGCFVTTGGTCWGLNINTFSTGRAYLSWGDKILSTDGSRQESKWRFDFPPLGSSKLTSSSLSANPTRAPSSSALSVVVAAAAADAASARKTPRNINITSRRERSSMSPAKQLRCQLKYLCKLFSEGIDCPCCGQRVTPPPFLFPGASAKSDVKRSKRATAASQASAPKKCERVASH